MVVGRRYKRPSRRVGWAVTALRKINAYGPSGRLSEEGRMERIAVGAL